MNIYHTTLLSTSLRACSRLLSPLSRAWPRGPRPSPPTSFLCPDLHVPAPLPPGQRGRRGGSQRGNSAAYKLILYFM